MIYLLEDDEGILNLTLYALRQAGLEAEGYSSSPLFWQAVRTKLPALVLLDVMLPGEDGLSVLKKLRASEATSRIPVMMLTALSTEYDKVRGLDLGADDYLPKPFGVMEMVARVRSLLRRSASGVSPSIGEGGDSRDGCLTAGGLSLDPTGHEVSAGGQTITLSLKEFETLAYMMRNKGVALSRDKIMDNVWGYDYDGENRTVDVHIRSLRQKLGAYERVIETVRGVGYRIHE